MSNVPIRRERPADISVIHAVHVASFPTAAEAHLVDLLRDAGRLSLSLVAEVDNTIVGHVAFSPVSAGSAASGAGLAPLAVLPAYRRNGIAARLVNAGLAACKEAGCGWAVVLGEPTYYARFGFQPAARFGLSDEYGGGDAFQVIELIAGQLPAGAGRVSYAAEFNSLGDSV